MTVSSWSPAAFPRDPWFRRRPIVALAVAGVLYAAVMSLRLLAGGPVDAYSMLYAFPVALVAITFGVRSGVAAGLLAVVLIVVWTIMRDVSLTPTGWAARVLPILLLGLVLGDASSRLSRAETERRRLEAAALLHREAIEINDSLVQGMAAARWSFEAGRTDASMRTLDETIIQGQDLVSDLIRRAGMADRTEQVGGVARSAPTTPSSDQAPSATSVTDAAARDPGLCS